MTRRQLERNARLILLLGAVMVAALITGATYLCLGDIGPAFLSAAVFLSADRWSDAVATRVRAEAKRRGKA